MSLARATLLGEPLEKTPSRYLFIQPSRKRLTIRPSETVRWILFDEFPGCNHRLAIFQSNLESDELTIFLNSLIINGDLASPCMLVIDTLSLIIMVRGPLFGIVVVLSAFMQGGARLRIDGEVPRVGFEVELLITAFS